MNENHDQVGKFGTTYQDEYAEQAAKLCARFGATDEDLSEFFGVSDRTIRRWKAQHPAFLEALTVGKDIADERVERSLYMRAVGFRIPAVKHFQSNGVILTEEYEEFVPPDTKAAIFWLCNRRKDRWSNAHMKGIGWVGDDATPQSVTVNIVDARAEPDPAAG